MTRYLLRRLLQAVPTVAGVVLVTFVLFQVVGGSPAAMVLGQNAGAASLEEFDAAHGYNKPLFFGNWAPTRALETVVFDENTPPSLRAKWGAEGDGPLRLAEGEELKVPFAFELPAGESWRLTVEWAPAENFPTIGKIFSNHWKTDEIFFQSLEKTGDSSNHWKKSFQSLEKKFPIIGKNGSEPEPEDGALFRAGEGGAVVRSVRLERKTRHYFDSQLWDYAKRVARWDLGTSTSLNRPVGELLREGVGPSLALTVPILIVELMTSLSLALLCAWKRGAWLDRALVGVCVGLMSVNYLVWIVAGQYVLAYRWGWFPVWGFESWRNLLLPVIIGAATGVGANVRFYRTVLLEQMGREYVRTARAKGVSSGRILFVHVLKNAMGPVVTNVALALPYLYTGSLLLEGFFGIPGLGYLSLNAVQSADVEVVRGVVLVGALLFTLANVLADLALAWVDPRVRLS
jgi:peptide/nickel transport system permease protein